MGQDIDMRQFARSAGTNVSFPSGSVVFNKGDPGICMYIVQTGVIEMTIGDTVIETVGPNEAIGFMSMIDGAARSSTARVRENCELSVINARMFRFMVDEVPIAFYIMGVLAPHPRNEQCRPLSRAARRDSRAQNHPSRTRRKTPFARGFA